MSFAKDFLRAREERGYSQRQLAAALGVSRSVIARWEAGDNEPAPRMMAGLVLAKVKSLPKCSEPRADTSRRQRRGGK